MRLIFAFFTFISLVSFNHVSAEDGWLYPGRPDDNFLDPKSNPNWTIGSTQHLQWYVSLSMYYLALVQKDNKAKPVTMLIVFDGTLISLLLLPACEKYVPRERHSS
jgi:hypothetical protein